MSWEPTQIRVRPGDTITSKGGLLFSSNLTGKEEFYTTKRVKYLGDGVWEARGESKQPIEGDPVQQGGHTVPAHTGRQVIQVNDLSCPRCEGRLCIEDGVIVCQGCGKKWEMGLVELKE